MSTNKVELVQCFGKKRSAVAVATVRHGKGLLRVNGCPVDTIQP
jgi:small subunit ribosomal protein S16e